jgi:hypothetical protein
MWRREKLLPNSAIGEGPAWTIALAWLPAKFLPLPTSAVDASKLKHPGTARVDRATAARDELIQSSEILLPHWALAAGLSASAPKILIHDEAGER